MPWGKNNLEWDILRAKIWDEVEKRPLWKSAIGLHGTRVHPSISQNLKDIHERRRMAGAGWFPLSPVVEAIGLPGKLETQL